MIGATNRYSDCLICIPKCLFPLRLVTCLLAHFRGSWASNIGPGGFIHVSSLLCPPLDQPFSNFSFFIDLSTFNFIAYLFRLTYWSVDRIYCPV